VRVAARAEQAVDRHAVAADLAYEVGHLRGGGDDGRPAGRAGIVAAPLDREDEERDGDGDWGSERAHDDAGCY